MAIPASSPPPLQSQSEGREEEDPVSPAQNPTSMDQQQLEKRKEEELNQSDPHQASETLALELSDLRQTSSHADPQDPELQLNENFINEHDPSDQGESTLLSPRIADVNALVSSMSVSRRGSKRKKGSMRRRFLQEKSQKKLEILVDTFKPIPFIPAKNLDFSSHEKLLKRLGLWDFVHTKFDRVVQHDLLLQLVANFNNSLRYSYVNGNRIGVNRADLARALRLPVKKTMVVDDGEEDPIASEESIAFIEDFVSNWLLLHEDIWMMPNEVMNWTKVIKDGNLERVDWAGLIWFMVEKELMQSPQLVNCYYASHLQCLIRSQREDLMKEEAPEVEDLELKEEVEQGQGQELEQEQDVERDDEDGVCNESQKMVGNDDSVVKKLEEHSIELCLGPDNVGKVDVQKEKASVGNMMDLMEMKNEEEEEEERQKEKVSLQKEKASVGDMMDLMVMNKEEEEEEQRQKEKASVGDMMHLMKMNEEDEEEEEQQQGQWFLDGKGRGLEPLLRRCNTHEFKEFDFGDEKLEALEEGDDQGKEEEEEVEEEEVEEEEEEEVEEEEEEQEEQEQEEEEEEEEEDQEDEFRLLPRSNPIDGFPSSQFIDDMETEAINFNSEFEIHGHSPVEFLPTRDDSRISSGECIPFVNSNKRVIDPDIDNPAPSLNGGNKRLRSEGPLDYDKCMYNVQQWLDKARMMYAEKEQVHQQATMNQQYLIHELQQRETFIEQLRKTKFEEQQKMQSDIYRLERELYVMGDLLDGYRKALKESHKAFANYRARFPKSDEPLYKDVPGSGGLVLSSMELERMRLKKAEEDRLNRLVVEKKFKDLEDKFVDVFHRHLEEVSSLDNRLVGVGNQVKTMRESLANRKVPKTPEPISTE